MWMEPGMCSSKEKLNIYKFSVKPMNLNFVSASAGSQWRRLGASLAPVGPRLTSSSQGFLSNHRLWSSSKSMTHIWSGSLDSQRHLRHQVDPRRLPASKGKVAASSSTASPWHSMYFFTYCLAGDRRKRRRLPAIERPQSAPIYNNVVSVNQH